MRRPIRPARRTPRRRTAARAPGRPRGRPPSPACWRPRRPLPAAAAPPPRRRPVGGPDVPASPSGRRTLWPRSWRRPPHRDRRFHLPAPGARAGSGGSAVRRTRRTRPCRNAAPSATHQQVIPGLSATIRNTATSAGRSDGSRTMRYASGWVVPVTPAPLTAPGLSESPPAHRRRSPHRRPVRRTRSWWPGSPWRSGRGGRAPSRRGTPAPPSRR